MRFLSFILACQICFLTADPVVKAFAISYNEANNPCTAYSCGESDDDTGCNKKSPNDCGKDDVCNPFEACFYCCLNIAEAMPYAPYFNPPFQLIPHTNNNTVLEFCSDCFRPPEVA